MVCRRIGNLIHGAALCDTVLHEPEPAAVLDEGKRAGLNDLYAHDSSSVSICG